MVLYNSLAHSRQQIVMIRVSIAEDSQVMVMDEQTSSPIPSQLTPLWPRQQRDALSEDVFSLYFEAKLPPLGTASYRIIAQSNVKQPAVMASSTIYSPVGFDPISSAMMKRMNIQRSSTSCPEVVLENEHISLQFAKDHGMLSSLTTKSTRLTTEVEEDILMYTGSRSGAYLFHPDGAPRSIVTEGQNNVVVVVVKGSIVSELYSYLNSVTRLARIYHTNSFEGRAVEMAHMHDITSLSNVELVVRYSTSIRNERVFFTDLNGLQMARRRTNELMPMEGNFFPMPNRAFMQADRQRFSVHTRQALGISSLVSGRFEILIDRRPLNQDDRGLPIGTPDTKPHHISLFLSLETLSTQSFATDELIANPSLFSHHLGARHNYPIYKLHSFNAPALKIPPAFSFLAAPFPCHMHLVNHKIWSQKQDNSVVLLHNQGFDCRFTDQICSPELQSPVKDWQNFFQHATISRVVQSSISLLHDETEVTANPIDVPPMEIHAFKLRIVSK